MSGDCPECGARERHQRRTMRLCEQCDRLFVVPSEKSLKRFCDRVCQLRAYAAGRR